MRWVSAAHGPVVEPSQSSGSWTCFQENVGYEALTASSGCSKWSDRRPTTKLSALRPKLNDVLSSSFLTVLCALSILISAPQKLNISDWPIILYKQLTRLWLANLFTTSRAIAPHIPKRAKRIVRGLQSTRLTTNTFLLPLLTELSLVCPLSLSIYTDHWWSHIR